MSPSLPLFLVGYPVAVGVIVRWLRVVGEGRTRWFVAHTAAAAAITGGWALERRWTNVVVNGGWLVASVAWYAIAGRRRAPSGGTINSLPRT